MAPVCAPRAMLAVRVLCHCGVKTPAWTGVSEVSLSVCHSCVGECVTMLKNQFVGHHNGFEDLRSTLLQQPPRRPGDVTEHQITNGVSSDAVGGSRPGRQVMLQRSRKRRHHEVF